MNKESMLPYAPWGASSSVTTPLVPAMVMRFFNAGDFGCDVPPSPLTQSSLFCALEGIGDQASVVPPSGKQPVLGLSDKAYPGFRSVGSPIVLAADPSDCTEWASVRC